MWSSGRDRHTQIISIQLGKCSNSCTMRVSWKQKGRIFQLFLGWGWGRLYAELSPIEWVGVLMYQTIQKALTAFIFLKRMRHENGYRV